MDDSTAVLATDWFTQFGHDLLRLLLAVAFGGVVGLEREFRDKPAGFRTIVLICVGACVFTIVSQRIGGPDQDHTRIAAQIVSGIGFLGAGAIIRDRASVVGLTTAATIWAVAAIGTALGFGELGLAAVGTLIILLSLAGLDFIERWIGRLRDIQEFHFAAIRTDDALRDVRTLFAQAGLQVRKLNMHEEDELLVFYVRAMGAKAAHEQLRMSLASSKEYQLRRS